MKRCAIISGGAFAALEGIETADFIIACDKGCQYAQENGIRPDLLVGDFDSYTGALPAGIPRLDLPVEKDDTDTMAALRWATDAGYRDFVLYCALGGRLDHLLGNLQAAAFAVERGARVKLIDTDNTLDFWTGGSRVFPYRAGYSLSVLAVTDVCRGVSIVGAKYPLTDAVLRSSFPLGVSNEWLPGVPVTVTVSSGILAVVQSRM